MKSANASSDNGSGWRVILLVDQGVQVASVGGGKRRRQLDGKGAACGKQDQQQA